MRLEDIDPPREVEGAADAIIRTLRTHGFRWDGDIVFQSERRARHDAVIESLLARGDAYYCQCSRRALRAKGHTEAYPGWCRERQHTSGAVRLRVPEDPVDIVDRWQGRRAFALNENPGDFIIRRSDGLIAYQLAVTVDDADQGVTDVVRGYDIYPSTPRQHWLQTRLGLPHPNYAHFPILIGTDGRKLSKQTGAEPLHDRDAHLNMLRALELLDFRPPRAERAAPLTSLLDWAQSAYRPDIFRGRREIAIDAGRTVDPGSE